MSTTTTTTTTKEEDDETFVWYFAIGSMTNPMSLKGRGIVPEESEPAEILDHRLHFFGGLGFAEAVPEEGSSFHGVLHRMKKSMMIRLDHIERGYTRQPAKVRRYNDDEEVMDATVYTRPDAERSPETDKPPTERYVGIIIEGCRHFGVSPKHIKMLEEMDCVPRTDPSEYKSFSAEMMDHHLPRYTLDQVKEMNKNDRVVFTYNTKVIECVKPPASTNEEQQKKNDDFWERMNMFLTSFGCIGEVSLSKGVYDPKFGVMDSLDNVTSEYAAYAEDMFYRFMESDGHLDCCRMVGKFADQETIFEREST